MQLLRLFLCHPGIGVRLKKCALAKRLIEYDGSYADNRRPMAEMGERWKRTVRNGQRLQIRFALSPIM